MRCFTVLHKSRVESIEELIKDQTASPEQKIHAAQDRGKDAASAFSKAERTASICLWVCGILFCLYAVVSAQQITSAPPKDQIGISDVR